jgi:tRNA pseudouridine55 synthase
MNDICGILNLDKPPGATSRDVVNRVQRLARGAKVGHAGTLDPIATGVLLVCVGRATRLIRYAQSKPKSYRATFLLGRSSPTDDVEGPTTPDPAAEDPATRPTREAIERATQAFVGRIDQRPPAYSAVKVAGRRAYDLARRGKDVELKPRKVDVYRFGVLRYEYPELEVDVRCGGGTYVRALGRDLAAALGTTAVMSALRRTAIGDFRAQEAIDPASLEAETWRDLVQPALAAVSEMPRVALNDEQVSAVKHGKWLPLDDVLPDDVGSPEELAAIDPAGRLTAILVQRLSSDESNQGVALWSPRLNL